MILFILFLKHIVKEGENLYSIGKIYSVDPYLICSYNKLSNCDNISPKQVLNIPETTISSSYVMYTVKDGDYLGKIASKFGISIDSIARINNIKNKNRINVGQRLRIPSSDRKTTQPIVSDTSDYPIYVVKKNDYLSTIAAKYSTTVDILKKLNDIKNVNVIFVGQKLKLPIGSKLDTSKISNSKPESPVNVEKRNDLINPSTYNGAQTGNADQLSQNVFDLAFGVLKREEGIKTDQQGNPKAYKDSLGKWTIGYGHLCGDGKSSSMCPKWTIEDAETEFAKDIQSHFAGAMKYKSISDAYNAIDDHRRVILISMAFQLGPGALNKFTEVLPNLVKHNWDAAAKGMKNSKWYKQTQNRADRHIEVILTGYCSDYSKTVSPVWKP